MGKTKVVSVQWSVRNGKKAYYYSLMTTDRFPAEEITNQT